MRIALTRTCGFAGLTRRAEVETSGRPDAEEWHRLAEEVRATGPKEPPRDVPDGFRYTLALGEDTVHCADPELSPAQRTLVRRLLREGD